MSSDDLNQIVNITGVSEDQAKSLLSAGNNSVDTAINIFFDTGVPEANPSRDLLMESVPEELRHLIPENLIDEQVDPEKLVGHLERLHDLSDQRGRTMHEALKGRNLFQVQSILSSGFNPDEELPVTTRIGLGGLRAIHFAAQTALVDILSLLLVHNANPNIEDDEGDSPLDLICKTPVTPELEECAVRLLEGGGDPETMDSDEDTLLYNAIAKGMDRFALACIECGANLRHVNKNGMLAISFAVSKKNFTVVEAMLAKDPTLVNVVQPRNGATPLAASISSKNTQMSRLLLKNGANPHMGDRQGNLPLHLAIIYGDGEEDLNMLIDYGVNPRVESSASASSFRSPLDFAISRNDIRAMEILLDAGAIPTKLTESLVENKPTLQLKLDTWKKKRQPLLKRRKSSDTEQGSEVPPLSVGFSNVSLVSEAPDSHQLEQPKENALHRSIPSMDHSSSLDSLPSLDYQNSGMRWSVSQDFHAIPSLIKMNSIDIDQRSSASSKLEEVGEEGEGEDGKSRLTKENIDAIQKLNEEEDEESDIEDQNAFFSEILPTPIDINIIYGDTKRRINSLNLLSTIKDLILAVERGLNITKDRMELFIGKPRKSLYQLDEDTPLYELGVGEDGSESEMVTVATSYVPPDVRPFPTDEMVISPDKGDVVYLTDDLELAQSNQCGHGGWSIEMSESLAQVGTVLKVDGDGDLVVDFKSDRCYCWNPTSFKKTVVSFVGEGGEFGSSVKAPPLINYYYLDRVAVKLKPSHIKYFPGTVIEVSDPLIPTYLVEFDDGEAEENCCPSQMRLIYDENDFSLPKGIINNIGIVGAVETGGFQTFSAQFVQEARRCVNELGVEGEGAFKGWLETRGIRNETEKNNLWLKLSAMINHANEMGGDVSLTTLQESRQLADCIKEGRFLAMKRIFAGGYSENELIHCLTRDDGSKGVYPLHFAAHHGRKKMCEFLLEKGADIESVDSMGNNALHSCLASPFSTVPKREECGLLLVKHGVSINYVDREGFSLLELAVAKGFEKLSALMVSNPTCDLSYLDKQGQSIPVIAISKGNVPIIQSIVKHRPADEVVKILNQRQNNEFLTPLIQSIVSKEYQIFSILLRAGVNPNIPGSGGKTPLHFAVEANDFQCVQVLLACGANPRVISASRQTPYDLARMMNHDEILLHLSSYGSFHFSKSLAYKSYGTKVSEDYHDQTAVEVRKVNYEYRIQSKSFEFFPEEFKTFSEFCLSVIDSKIASVVGEEEEGYQLDENIINPEEETKIPPEDDPTVVKLTEEGIKELTVSLELLPCPDQFDDEVFHCLPRDDQINSWVGLPLDDLLNGISKQSDLEEVIENADKRVDGEGGAEDIRTVIECLFPDEVDENDEALRQLEEEEEQSKIPIPKEESEEEEEEKMMKKALDESKNEHDRRISSQALLDQIGVSKMDDIDDEHVQLGTNDVDGNEGDDESLSLHQLLHRYSSSASTIPIFQPSLERSISGTSTLMDDSTSLIDDDQISQLNDFMHVPIDLKALFGEDEDFVETQIFVPNSQSLSSASRSSPPSFSIFLPYSLVGNPDGGIILLPALPSTCKEVLLSVFKDQKTNDENSTSCTCLVSLFLGLSLIIGDWDDGDGGEESGLYDEDMSPFSLLMDGLISQLISSFSPSSLLSHFNHLWHEVNVEMCQCIVFPHFIHLVARCVLYSSTSPLSSYSIIPFIYVLRKGSEERLLSILSHTPKQIITLFTKAFLFCGRRMVTSLSSSVFGEVCNIILSSSSNSSSTILSHLSPILSHKLQFTPTREVSSHLLPVISNYIQETKGGVDEWVPVAISLLVNHGDRLREEELTSILKHIKLLPPSLKKAIMEEIVSQTSLPLSIIMFCES